MPGCFDTSYVNGKGGDAFVNRPTFETQSTITISYNRNPLILKNFQEPTKVEIEINNVVNSLGKNTYYKEERMTAFWDIAPCSVVEVGRRWIKFK
jgi:hypothetical protein